jgi:hypothetical protein
MAPRRARAIAGILDDSLHERSDEVLALVPDTALTTVDSLSTWATRYQQLAVAGVRSQEVAKKIAHRGTSASLRGWRWSPGVV